MNPNTEADRLRAFVADQAALTAREATDRGAEPVITFMTQIAVAARLLSDLFGPGMAAAALRTFADGYEEQAIYDAEDSDRDSSSD